MNKGQMEVSKIVALIIALVVLTLILVYVFSTSGGPKDLIDSILGFMNSSVDYVTATGKI